MRIEYDPEADALYLQFRPVAPGTAQARPITDDVIADYGPDGRLVGLEILDASAVLGADGGDVTLEVAGQQRVECKPGHGWAVALLSVTPRTIHDQLSVRERPERHERRAGVAEVIATPTLADIRQVVERIVARFRPRKVVLFGSYAGGTPSPDSDVDLLVEMETRLRSVEQAVAIRRAVDFPFPTDLLVRTPQQIAERLALGDAFWRDVVTKGIVLYEAADVGVR